MAGRAWRVLGFLVAGGVGLTAAFVVSTKARAARVHEAPYPEVALRADPEVLARGEYLVWNVVGCDKCHLPHDVAIDRPVDARPDLEGGWVQHAPGLGSLHFPNITPHPELGIGRYEPREVARLLRTGILPDGTLGLTMAGVVGDMSDDDLAAIVSYLYSRPPVARDVGPSEFGFLYEALMAWLFTEPLGKVDVADPAPPVAPTVARGAYLALGPAGCVGCHTPRDASFALRDDQRFGGCSLTQDDLEAEGMVTCAPNLTPDPTTGYIADWSEQAFVARMRAGRAIRGSNMPWEAFRGLHDDDLRALYAFLRTVDPVVHDPGPPYRSADWAPAE